MPTPKKRKKSKAFWNNIKFRYKLTIVNENTLEEVVGLHVSKLNGISGLAPTVGGTAEPVHHEHTGHFSG